MGTERDDTGAPASGPTFAGQAAQRAAGLGLGWNRLSTAIGDALPPAEIERIWLFPPVRREEREWGTAVVARRADGGRLRVYTGSYMLIVRGRERGQSQVTVDEVGESPDAVLAEVVQGVRERAGEAEPPVEIDPAVWFERDDEPAPTG